MTDTKKTPENTDQPEPKTIATELTKLSEEFSRWHKKSRPELYEILAGCFQLALEIKKDDEKAKELEKYLTENSVKPDSRSTVYHKVIRSVVGKNQHSRVHRYGKVLKKAGSASVKPPDLAKWIEDREGIGKISEDNLPETKKSPVKAKSQPDHNQQALIERGQRRLERCETLVKFSRIPSIPKDTKFVLLVGEISTSDKIDLKKFLPDQSALNDILSAAGKQDAADGKDADGGRTTNNVSKLSADQNVGQKEWQAA